jgi:single-stranded-DNA-specific exonuclease
MFATREVKVLEARAVGKKGSHLKMTLQRDRRVFDAIAFRLGHVLENLRPMIDVAFHFERNLYMGVESLQLNVKDIRNS